MKIYLSLLRRNPGYVRLWLAQSVSLLGDWFNTIALSALVTSLTDGSGPAISALLLARFLPPLLAAPFVGVVADRFDRRRILILSDVLRVGTVLLFLLVDTPEELWLLYLLTVFQFSLSALFEPARSALLPSLVSREDLVTANVLGSITWSVMLAAGAALGGLVAGLFGVPTALLIDALTFLLSALLIISIRVPPHRPEIIAPEKRPTDEGSFREGWQYVRAHPATAATLLVKAGGNIGSVDALMIIYATQIFILGENGSGSLGLLYAFFGVGAVLGPLLAGRFHDGSIRPMRRWIVAAYALITVGWLLFGVAGMLVVAGGALLVKAMGSSIYWTYSSAILQKTVPDRYLGRIFAFDLAGFQAATVVSVLITGWLTAEATVEQVRWIVVGTGLLSLAPLLLWALALRWLNETAAPVAAPPALPEAAD
ncbi:MAG: MFS transporter [Anaerolineae bacterium]|nr:MFS transporter [Anaerolineae bacterium]